MNTRKMLLGSIASAVLFVASNNANATLLAYEGFDYSLGNLSADNGGIGWSTAWAQNGGNIANSQVISGSYSYTDINGYSLVTSGNRALITGDGASTGDNVVGANNGASPLRKLNFIRGTSGNTESTWMSFLALRTGNPTPTPGSSPNDYLYGRSVGVQFFYNATTTATAQGN